MNQKNKSLKTNPKGEMSFFDHLEELRWHIIKSLVVIVLMAIIVFLFQDFVFGTIIKGPKQADFPTYRFFCNLSERTCIQPPDFQILTRELGEQFFVAIKVSFILGFILAFPYVFYQMWIFISPGLYSKEKRAAKGIVFSCSLLFFLGILFGYFIISPFAISFLAGYSVGIDAITSPTLASYVGYITMLTIPPGILFELPIVVHFLARVGLVTPEFMRKYRKHALIIILVLAAVITPPDITSQLLIGFPIFILYEISIYVARRAYKKYENNNPLP